MWISYDEHQYVCIKYISKILYYVAFRNRDTR